MIELAFKLVGIIAVFLVVFGGIGGLALFLQVKKIEDFYAESRGE